MASHKINAVRLEELRLRKGLTQTELAKAAGISRPTVQRAESGDRLSPGIVQKIAKALGVLADELIIARPGDDSWRGKLEPYLNELRKRFGEVYFLGLPGEATGGSHETEFRPRLDELYVEHYVLTSPVPARAVPPKWTGPTSTTILAQPGHKLLRGDPGVGKSTIIQKIVIELSQPHATKLSRAMGDRVAIPLIVRDLVIGAQSTFRSIIESFYHKTVNGLITFDELWECITSGRALLLLDGLDEVSPGPRKHLRAAVFQAMRDFPDCQWIMTSRIIGYEEVPFDRQRIPKLDPEMRHRERGDPLSAISPKSPRERSEPSEDTEEWADTPEDDTLLTPTSPASAPLPPGEGPGVRVDGKKTPAITTNPDGSLRSRGDFGEIADNHSPEFAPAEVKSYFLAPFDNPQIQRFIQNWYRARKLSDREAEEKSDSFWRVIADPRRMSNLILARIPNVLVIMANLHNRLGVLPDGRAKLYGDIATAYLESIDRARRLKRVEGLQADYDDQLLWFGRIAWELQSNRQSNTSDDPTDTELIVPKQKIIAWVHDEQRQVGKPVTDAEIEGFLKAVEVRSGLLIDRAEGQYAFVHLTFAEFFAALHLIQNLNQWKLDQSPEYQQLREWSGNPLWHELLIFAFEEMDAKRSREWKHLLEAVFPWFTLEFAAQFVTPPTAPSSSPLPPGEGPGVRGDGKKTPAVTPNPDSSLRSPGDFGEIADRDHYTEQLLLLTRLGQDTTSGFERQFPTGVIYRDLVRPLCEHWAEAVDPLNADRWRTRDRFTDRWLAEMSPELALNIWDRRLRRLLAEKYPQHAPALLGPTSSSSSPLPGEGPGVRGERREVRDERREPAGHSDGSLRSPGDFGEIADNGPPLTAIDLSGYGLSPTAARALVRIIAQHLPLLTTLDLSRNQIGDDGARDIAQHLPLLTTLYLSDNQIGDAGARDIAQNLPLLTTLDLLHNKIGDAGARDIAQKLPLLTTLNLWDNQIGDAGARDIAQNLPRLTTLYLGSNKIGDAGARDIAQHLPLLTTLYLGDNQIGEAAKAELRELFRQRGGHLYV